MDDFRRERQLDRIWSNHDKRTAFVVCEDNWIMNEELPNIRIKALKFTPFIKVQVRVFNKWINQYMWQTATYHKTEDGKISNATYEFNSITDYMKQFAYTLKQERRLKP